LYIPSPSGHVQIITLLERWIKLKSSSQLQLLTPYIDFNKTIATTKIAWKPDFDQLHCFVFWPQAFLFLVVLKKFAFLFFTLELHIIYLSLGSLSQYCFPFPIMNLELNLYQGEQQTNHIQYNKMWIPNS
jgi:hypothetical protein